MYLSTNQLGPAFEGMELGIGESIIMKAIGETCGKARENSVALRVVCQ